MARRHSDWSQYRILILLNCSARIAELEADLRVVREELQKEKEDKVDLVSEKARCEEEWREKESEMEEKVEVLTNQLEEANAVAEARSQVNREYIFVSSILYHF